MSNLCQSALVGIVGGAGAGLTILIVRGLWEICVIEMHKKRVYNFLERTTSEEPRMDFRSTKAIASHTNLTMDRVRYICSIHKKIHLSTGEKDDMWSIYGNKPKIGGPITV